MKKLIVKPRRIFELIVSVILCITFVICAVLCAKSGVSNFLQYINTHEITYLFASVFELLVVGLGVFVTVREIINGIKKGKADTKLITYRYGLQANNFDEAMFLKNLEKVLREFAARADVPESDMNSYILNTQFCIQLVEVFDEEGNGHLEVKCKIVPVKEEPAE